MSYLVIVQPHRRCDARASQSETVEEVMQHQVFSWYNCGLLRVSAEQVTCFSTHMTYIDLLSRGRPTATEIPRGNPAYVLKLAYLKDHLPTSHLDSEAGESTTRPSWAKHRVRPSYTAGEKNIFSSPRTSKRRSRRGPGPRLTCKRCICIDLFVDLPVCLST